MVYAIQNFGLKPGLMIQRLRVQASTVLNGYNLFFCSGHFYVHRRCAIWSEKVKSRSIKSEEESPNKKSKETETYVGVDQVTPH
jgi:hypothetical protein